MKRLSLFLLVVISLGAVLPPASAGQAQKPSNPQASPETATTKQTDDPRLREFENFVRAQMQRDRIPGLTIGFFKDDQTWVKAFGYSDVENKTPATENSAYRIASTTKTMTGVAIVQLWERG